MYEIPEVVIELHEIYQDLELRYPRAENEMRVLHQVIHHVCLGNHDTAHVLLSGIENDIYDRRLSCFALTHSLYKSLGLIKKWAYL